MIVRKAKEEDLLMMQKLLAKCGVREDGIEEHLDHFLVISDEQNRIVGTIGIEKYAENGLLRSFVFDSTLITARVSLQFLEAALYYAKEQKMTSLYLCTKGKSVLFQELGFRSILFKEVPKDIQQSMHFRNQLQDETKIWTCAL